MSYTKMAIVFCSLFLLSGCAGHSIKVIPEQSNISNDFTVPLECKIEYDGSNQEYLPTALHENESATQTASYHYEVHYLSGNTNWDKLNIFNPLMMVGFPMSEESVIVEAKLQLKEQETLIKEFEASCIANKTRNIFQNGGSSEPRKACLLAIRDNIDQQIKHYQKELEHE